MARFTVQELLDAIPGSRLEGKKGTARRGVVGISTDTRSLKTGEAFVALSGENFDGHRFLGEAAKAGAKVAVVEEGRYRMLERLPDDLPLIVVDDALTAYGAIAAAHRRRFAIPVVAVAGSNGKTSTKELIASVLGTKYRVLKTEGNLNNRVGAPATILRITEEHEVAVVEIGTNMPGEIAILCEIVEPTHGVITNIGREHLELLGSLEGVAEEEGALFRYLDENGGIAAVNLDDRYVARMGRSLAQRVTYGKATRADFRVRTLGRNADGTSEIEIAKSAPAKGWRVTADLAMPGAHAAANAIAAAAIGDLLKVPRTKIVSGLEGYRPSVSAGGYARLTLMQLPRGGAVLNDTYNANPDSVMAALDTLASLKPKRGGRRIVVLGDMAELGAHAAREHREIGERIATMKKVDVAMFFGPGMKKAHDVVAASSSGVEAHAFRSKERLIEALNALRTPEDVILVKGSRSTRMEEVIAGMKSIESDGRRDV